MSDGHASPGDRPTSEEGVVSDTPEEAQTAAASERTATRVGADLRTAWVVLRTELRAQLRRLTSDRRQLLGILLGFGSFVFWPLLVRDELAAFGRRAAAGEPGVAAVGGTVASAVGLGLFAGFISAVNRNRVGSVGPLLRTTSPPRAVAVGRLGSELIQSVIFFVPAVIVVGGVIGIGARDPALPVVLGLGTLCPLLAGVLFARTVGSLARLVGFLSGLSVWTKVVAFVGLFGGSIAGSQYAIAALFDDGPFAGRAGAILPARPAQAYAEAVLVPYGTTPEPVGVGLLALVLAAIPVGLVATARVETRILLRDEGTGPTDDYETQTARVPWPFTRTLTTRIAWRQLRRTRRDPRSLAHLTTFVVGPTAGIGFLIAQPALATRVAGAGGAAIGTLVAAAAYCLNPLGDDREQLPWLVTTLASTGPLLRARVVAGLVLATPFAGAGVALAAIGFSPIFALALTGVVAVLAPAAGGIALGVGAIAPKFERQEYLNVERAHPSQPALLGFFFGGSVVVSVGILLVWLPYAGLVPVVAAAVAVVVYLGLVAGGGVVGYVYARRRFDALTLDDV